MYGNVYSSFRRKEMELAIKVEEPVKVLGDSNRLMQIMMNLLTNAITYSSENTTLHITIVNNEKYGIFRIQDEGIGITKKRLVEYLNVFTGWTALEVGTQVVLA